MTPLAGWGPVRQLGYVVQNLDQAVEAWSRQLGVGPWTIMRNVELSSVYRGEPSRPVIDLALAYRGEQQIELIQQTNDAPSPYRPFIERGHYGLHHFAFLAEQIDEAAAQGQAAGLQMVCDIRMPGGNGRYVYFASPVQGEQTYVELLQATGMMKQMFAAGMLASKEWQGELKPMVFDLGPFMRLLRFFGRIGTWFRR